MMVMQARLKAQLIDISCKAWMPSQFFSSRVTRFSFFSLQVSLSFQNGTKKKEIMWVYVSEQMFALKLSSHKKAF